MTTRRVASQTNSEETHKFREAWWLDSVVVVIFVSIWQTRMNWISGFIILFSVFTTSYALECYRCTSNDTLDCLEKFMHPNPLRAESCSDVYGAKYCIKTTGIYDGVLGTRRFCHDKDMGNKCEFFTHEGREYKGCVYTCATDGCNAATMNFSYFPIFRNLILLMTILKFLNKFL